MSDMVSPSTDLKAYQLIYSSPNNLNQLKQEAKTDQQKALKPVAEQFEALFLSQILKEANKVKFDDGWMDGKQADFYKDWYDQQIAQDLSSKGSLGLADMIVKQLAPKSPVLKSNQLHGSLTSSIEATSNTGASASSLTTAENLALRPQQNNASAD